MRLGQKRRIKETSVAFYQAFYKVRETEAEDFYLG
jgi:hypothetical protein